MTLPISSRRRALQAATGLSLSWLSAPGIAQEAWPNRPVKLIVPGGAGSGTDLVARVFAESLGSTFKQPFVVDNRAGANGMLGSQIAAKAPADGYTLLFLAASLHTFSPHLMKDMKFDTVSDITPISVSVQFPYVLAVNADSPYKTVGDLVKAARSQPGKLAYGSFGIGSGPNIISELFKQQTGTDILHVPYKGGSQVTAALMGGEIPFMFDSLPSPLGQIRGGKLRALAVTGATRSSLVPEVPTLKESGVNIEAIIWLGLGGPPKLPPDVTARLFDAMKQISTDPDLQKRMADMGAEATVSKSPEEFRQFMLAERERWGKVIREAKISAN